MIRPYQHLLQIAASLWLVLQGCSFFTSPQEAETFGEIEINIRFAGTNSTVTTSDANLNSNDDEVQRIPVALSKDVGQATPSSVDRIVVAILEHPEFEQPGQHEAREIIRREFRIGDERILKAVIQVPLRQEGGNCFLVRVEAFQGNTLLYSGQDFQCFQEKERRLAATILMQPTAFSVFVPVGIDTSSNRIKMFSGQVQDTAVTRIEIVADSVLVNLPIPGPIFFDNPVMLFGDTTMVRVRAFSQNEFRGEVSRRIVYTGRKADLLVALVWDQPVDLDLEIFNPLQQVISATATGDSINGFLRVSDSDGFGPEVYEWRENSRFKTGPFEVRVVKPRTVPTASGKVYLFFREGQITQRRRSIPFSFAIQETIQTVDSFTWPIQ